MVLVIMLALSSWLRAATVIWVSDTRVAGREQGWIDVLEANGYTVDLSFQNQEGRVLDAAELEVLNAADLIIIARDMLSAEYSGGTEPTEWNSLTTPLIMVNGWLPGSERWKWLAVSTNVERAISNIEAVAPNHPVFTGVALDANNQVDMLTSSCQFTDTTDPGNGTLIARNVSDGDVWIVEWTAGQEFYPGSGQVAGGQRMLLVAGNQPSPGEYNLTAEGEKVFLNAVRYMLGIKQLKAYNPMPADGAVHEDTWVSLGWSPGDSAVSHDVYLGDSFDDVNDGAPYTFRGNQANTTVLVGFAGFPYPDGLAPGTTYYWRIDEVNEAEPNGPWRGDVWSFSIPPRTAYSPDPADDAESVDLNAVLTWKPGFGAKLHHVYFGDSLDDVNSAGGALPQGVTTYDPGPLELARTYYWRVDEFDAVNTYKGGVWSFTTEGTAASPNPVKGAVDVSPTPILTWAPSDLAASHDVYFGADADTVKNAGKTSPEYRGTRVLGDEHYDAGRLELETTYYWRIDEVNSTHPDSPWLGNVWSFTTGAFLVVDDFESYNDIEPPDPASNRIFDNWIDGFGTTTNGALVGNDLPPYAEQTIVHGGSQSMPYAYDNNLKTSEATMTLVYPRDWTEEGVARLSLWFRGAMGNSAERMFVALNGNAVVYHDDPAVAQTDQWTLWVIDLQAFADQGVNLANINTITIGFGTKNSPAASGTGTMYLDDIRLIR